MNSEYVESARVYLKQDKQLNSTIFIKCCLCNANALTNWDEFVSHLLSRHAALAPQQSEDEEIQAEIKLELANLKQAGVEEEIMVLTNTDKQPEPDFTDVEYLDEEEEQEEGQNFIQNAHNRPFYSLLHTRPQLMHYFIDLLVQHKPLWSLSSKRDERLERAQEISTALGQRFPGTSLQPQVICFSVRYLQTWFERQYVMHLSNSNFRCRYPEYYKKLLQFLPTKHISLSPINCDECERSFRNKYQLQLHKHRKHQGRNPNWCHVCDQGFLNASTLQLHLDRYHIKPTEWQCKLCEYNAPNKWDYQRHLDVHRGERNYTCEMCGHSCKTSSALAVHRRTHAQPHLVCPHCQKLFRENYLIKCHIKKSHVAWIDEIDQPNFEAT